MSRYWPARSGNQQTFLVPAADPVPPLTSGTGGGHADGAGVGERTLAQACASGVRTCAISAVACGPSRAHGRAAAQSVAFSTAACGFLARAGQLAVRADPAALGQPRKRVVPRLVGPAPHRLQVLPPQVQAAPQGHGLAAVDVRRREGREVPVAPVLAQYGGRLPEPGQTAPLGNRQRGVRRGQHPAGEVKLPDRPPEQVGGRGRVGFPPREQAAAGLRSRPPSGPAAPRRA